MSVVGIDFGCSHCTIAVARKGGIDVATNEVSRRQTPSIVGFGGNERSIGESGATQRMRNIKNTITDVKRFLGRSFDDPDVQREIKRQPYSVVKLDNGDVGFEVLYEGQKQVLSAVAITGALLGQLKQTTNAFLQSTSARDVVVSVPGYWTEKQRQALLDATSVAGLHCLGLINETTASAVQYGIYKTFEEGQKETIMIVDIGYSSMTCSITEFSKGKLKVLATTFDANFGGRDFNDLLVNHFAQEIKEKQKLDILSNRKATIKLYEAVEKMKKILNTNPDAVFNVDTIMEDTDVKGKLTRDDWNAMVKPVVDRLRKPVEDCLAKAGITAKDLQSVEITGGSSRLTPIQKELEAILGRPVSKTMNQEESVARGCALQSAILSPSFQVRPFTVQDITLYPIKLTWGDVGSADLTDGSVDLYSTHDSIPNPKLITISRKTGFEMRAEYADVSALPPGQPKVLATYKCPVLPRDPNTPAEEKSKIKLKVKLDVSGVFKLESCQLVESYEVEEPAPVQTPAPAAPAKDADAAKKDESAEAKQEDPTLDPKRQKTDPESEAQPDAQKPAEGEAKPDAKPEADAGNKDSQPAEPPKMIKKKKVRRTDLAITSDLCRLPKTALDAVIEAEGKMFAADKLAVETAEARNHLESYVCETRGKLEYDLREFVTDEQRTSMSETFTKMEDWLYEDGEDEKKSVYLAKLEEMKKLGDPVEKRASEYERRYDAVMALRKVIDANRMLSETKEPKYDHIETDDRAKVAVECANVDQWVTEKMAEQEKLPKTVDPVITVAEIDARKTTLDGLCKSIMNKPKPKPKEPEKKEEPKADAKNADAKETNGTKEPETAQKEQDAPKQNGTAPPAEDLD